MRRLVVLLPLSVLVLGGLFAVPAQADPGYFPAQKSGATVNHLAMTGRLGYLTVQISVGVGDDIGGVDVTIPADGGSWSTVPVSDGRSGLSCLPVAGAGLDLVCRTPDVDTGDGPGPGPVPVGRYDITVPVRRLTGPVSGAQGTVSLERPDPFDPATLSGEVADTFPVIDTATDPRSTAEVRALWQDPTQGRDWTLAAGILTIDVTVAPGEQVTDVDVVLPQGPGLAYTVADRDFGGGVSCGQDEVDAAPADGSFVIRCSDSRARGVWPAGPHELTLHVGSVGYPSAAAASVTLRDLGAAAYAVDSFTVRLNQTLNF